MPSHSKARGAACFAVAGLVAVSGFFAAAPAGAQEADELPVLAMVGGQPITEADLQFAAEDLGQDLNNIPAEQRRGFVLSMLIDMKVMAQAARAASMDETASYIRRKAYLEERALRRAYFEEVIAKSITEAEMLAAYQNAIAGFEPQEEIHARHILVASEADALAVIAELDAGASFEDLAREKSTDGSGPNGGDLGFFTRGQMIPVFEEAAFALEAGQVSAPVESEFGWHIIKLEERRSTPPPSFDELAPQLQQELLRARFDEMVGVLKAAAEIEILDPLLAPATPVAPAEEIAPGEAN